MNDLLKRTQKNFLNVHTSTEKRSINCRMICTLELRNMMDITETRVCPKGVIPRKAIMSLR